MRTTVTIDADVEQLLKDWMRRNHSSFKETLNQALRRGLSSQVGAAPEPFHVKARAMGLKSGIDPTGFNKLADELEAEAFLEAAEKKESWKGDHS